MKAAAVSQRIDAYPERNERRDALDQRLAVFLLEAGLATMPVPNGLSGADGPARLDDWIERVAPAAIVLSGGNDVGSCADRDLTERRLLDYARDHRLPVLGICRGMQMMAVWAGSDLKRVTGHVRTRHVLAGEITGEANSYHDITLAGLPPGFVALARSEDGEIEAMRHESLPWEGWMWHPERERPFLARDVERLKGLLGA